MAISHLAPTLRPACILQTGSTKPFGLRELLARVRAVLQRETRRAAVPDQARGRCRFGGWQLDRHSRRLTNPDAAPVALTKSEYAVLIAFLDAPQCPLTREHLLQATRVHEDVFDRSIDVQILRPRRKLEVDPSAPGIIQTERGVGQRLRPGGRARLNTVVCPPLKVQVGTAAFSAKSADFDFVPSPATERAPQR